jgi:hypothetical protein
LDLASFLAPGLDEDRQQDDPSARGDPIRDPCRSASEIEPEFAELAVQLLGVRFVE